MTAQKSAAVRVAASWTDVAVALSVSVSVGCAAAESRPAGPPPEYEPPQVLPWDSGGPEDLGDPFQSAAAGGWLDESDAGTSPGRAEDAASPPAAARVQDASTPPAEDSGPVESGPPAASPPAD